MGSKRRRRVVKCAWHRVFLIIWSINKLGEKNDFADTVLLTITFLLGKYLFSLSLFIYDMG
ncbi:hypothetical protein CRN74_14615 [Yersinia frederiksenii]|nr:hypothetical protein CRN74_14615 [Yersinia frederiksenii]